MFLILTAGGFCESGHRMPTHFVIGTEASAKQIDEAYEAGVKIIGYDISKTKPDTYGRLWLSPLAVEKLRIAGYKPNAREISGILEAQSFIDIYRYTVFKGNPLIHTYEMKNCFLEIGGYGLFG